MVDGNNPYAAHETPLQPVEIWMCCAVSRRGIVGSIFPENTINSERSTDMNTSGTLLKKKLPKHGSNKAAQLLIEHRWPCASYPYCSDVEQFWKEYGLHARRICHHHILFCVGLH
jgi:hypothetical protein